MDDWFFKLIGNENVEYVKYLLNCFLKFENPIEELHYQPTELNPLSKEKKLSIVDLMFKDALGRYFIIEMQHILLKIWLIGFNIMLLKC